MTPRLFLGHGVGLRVPHYDQALGEGLDVDWVECITENFFGKGGKPRAVLRRLRQDMPLVFHGVSMGIGSLSGPSTAYLSQLKELMVEFEPAWISDHLCWTQFGGLHSHDLLPLPYTEEAITTVSHNIERVQETLGTPMLFENVSSYVGFCASQMPEWEFLNEIARRTGCRFLLDVNNVVVSAKNHGYDPLEFITGINKERVWQLHLANHTDRGHYKFDSHQGPVPAEVWALYEATLKHMGQVSTLVEWDEGVPDWGTLRAEQRRAVQLAEAILGGTG